MQLAYLWVHMPRLFPAFSLYKLWETRAESCRSLATLHAHDRV